MLSFRLCSDNHSGLVLIVVLWVLVVLSVFVFVMGHGARTALAYAKYRTAKAKTEFYVFSGLFYAMQAVKTDRYRHGNLLVENDTGYFRIGRLPPDQLNDDNDSFVFEEENGRINLNGLDSNNYLILKELLVTLGFQENLSRDVAAVIVDWKDEDGQPVAQGGAEDSFYMTLGKPYHCKNRFFDTPEELLLVKGVTRDIFDALKKHITVFPRNDRLRINFYSASKEVLTALSRSVSGAITNTDRADADSLVHKILEYRRNNVDHKADFTGLALNAKERAIFLAISPYKELTSDIVRFRIQGMDPSSRVQTNVEVVVDTKELKILSWQKVQS